jgi:predicted dienelactone hydrolase
MTLQFRLGAVCLAQVGVLMAALAGPATAAGFRHVVIPDPGNAPIEANIWYLSSVPPRPNQLGLQTQMVAADAPAAGTGLGLVVISHGTGGDAAGHFDTAIALADAGFVVVAPSFTGDTWKDTSRAEMIWNRPRLQKVVLDYMLSAWPDRAKIDTNRVGAFGFSAGGFTELVAAGGTPDLSLVAPHCAKYPAEWTCGMIASHHGGKMPPPAVLPASLWEHDARIHAVVVAAPALGYTFGKAGLAGVTVPVQLWRAADDHVLPAPFYADAVAADLPTAPEYHVVKAADHMDFLVPCSAAFAKVVPVICTSAPGFDRAAFHAGFNREVVRFFLAHLKAT